jgi:lycopene beta-cyclase
MQQFDYIFAGFGLSGMTLFYELSKDLDFANKSVLIVDRDAKNQNDRTWSFWAEGDIELQHLVKKQWKRGDFYTMSGEHLPLRFDNHSYNTIEGADFYAFMNDFVAKFSNVQRIQADILSLSNEGILQSSQGEFSGKLVFRSYFDKSDFQPEKAKQFIWQHFYGYVIKTKEAKFDADTFSFMDYRYTDAHLTNFFYVLPYANNEALVEFTEFSGKMYSEAEYKKKLEGHISQNLGIDDYEILLTEYNAIPMTDFQMNTVQSKYVINIGSLAGYLKPSSGYAFTRTLARNKKLAQAIIAGEKLTEKSLNSNATYKAFDDAVLYLIATGRVHGALIFAALFKKRGPDFVFRFLDEKINGWGLFKVTLASPKKWEFVRYFILRFLGRA